MAQPAVAKWEVLWSPSAEDKYITFGSEITLYQVEFNRTQDSALVDRADKNVLSDDAFSYLLSPNVDSVYPKCIAWYPKPDHDHLVAVGQANGKILLTSLHSKSNDRLVGREFAPKHGRQCYCLAWNPDDSNLLAAGLDKTRNDPCILIWDVMQDMAPASPDRWGGQAGAYVSGGGHGDTTSYKALYELGSSEAAHSLAWFRGTKKTFVTGINKYLRIYDLRDSNMKPITTTTKCVHGVCIDPRNETLLASFVESQLCIWDTRSFEKPVYTFQEQRNICKISWCPTQSGLLASLQRDCNFIKIYDIGHMPSGSEDTEVCSSERKMPCPASPHCLSSFDWHPTHDQRMLTISVGGEVRAVKLYEKQSACLDALGGLTWFDGKVVYSMASGSPPENDILTTMRSRALKNYGLEEQESVPRVSSGAAGEDPQMCALWNWILLMEHLRQHVFRRSDGNHTTFLGIDGILAGRLRELPLSSTAEPVGWKGVETRNTRTWYTSFDRTTCLTVCGWPKGEELHMFINRLYANGNYEKAAAIAVFHLEIKLALDILNKGAVDRSYPSLLDAPSEQRGDATARHDLSVVAVALSGFAGKSGLWRESCRHMKERIGDAYIKAMFAFVAEDDDYSSILYEEKLSLADRIAFACLYLNDSKLSDYISTLKQSVVEKGLLSGVIITGLESDGIDLLQAYVDLTGDVQTASLAVAHSFPNSVALEDVRVEHWVQNYRHLLNEWKFFELRADFDIFFRKQWERSKEIFIMCNYCGKPAIHGDSRQRRAYSTYGGNPPSKLKVSVCVECRKPLPRCSLCLMSMGTSLTLARQPVHDHAYGRADDWFAWCQSCRHGGHAGHLREWFGHNNECMVSGCTCKCYAIDTIPLLVQQINLHD